MIRVYHLDPEITTAAERQALQWPDIPDWKEKLAKGALGTTISAARADVARELFAKDAYIAVAEVETDDPEAAFVATQNGVQTPSWSLQPVTGVTVLAKPHVIHGEVFGRKSSDIGDLVKCDGQFLMVDAFGFSNVAIDPATEEAPTPAAEEAPTP
jgi:hypothetical protein